MKFEKYRSIFGDEELAERLRRIRHVALDMDGTIYMGKSLFDCTKPFLASLREMGITYSFLTNNPSRSIDDYLRKLAALGIDASAEEMYTTSLAAIDYIIHTDRRPALLVVTDINDDRLARAAQILSPEEAAKNGVRLVYQNTKDGDPVKTLKDLNGGRGYDDVLCIPSIAALVQQADAILGEDGCLNFFSGPNDPNFSAPLNFYNIHYASTHVVGTSGGNTDDMAEALDMTGKGMLTPAILVTHVGGLNAVVETTKNLPNLTGGKKLIYTHIDMPLTAIADFAEKGKTDPMYAKLAELVGKTNGLWNAEAEKYLLDTLMK